MFRKELGSFRWIRSVPVEFSSGVVSSVERFNLSRGPSVGERSEDLSVNVSIATNVKFDLEVSSSDDLGGEVDGNECLVSGRSSSFDHSFAFNEELSLVSIRDFDIGGTTAHHF